MTSKLPFKLSSIKYNLITIFVAFGLLANAGLMLHQYMMFLKAYMSDQKAIILYINVFGEADMELVMLTIAAIVGVAATFYVLYRIKQLKPVVMCECMESITYEKPTKDTEDSE